MIQLPATLEPSMCWPPTALRPAPDAELPCAFVRERLEWIVLPTPRGANHAEIIGDLAGHVACCAACWQEYEDLRWILHGVEHASLHEPALYPAGDFSFLTARAPYEPDESSSA